MKLTGDVTSTEHEYVLDFLPRLILRSTAVPFSTVPPAAGVCDITLPASTESELSSAIVPIVSPSSSMTTFASSSVLPVRSGIEISSISLPELITTVTVLPFAAVVAPRGFCDMTFPFSTESLSWSCFCITKPSSSSLTFASASDSPTTSGTLTPTILPLETTRFRTVPLSTSVLPSISWDTI